MFAHKLVNSFGGWVQDFSAVPDMLFPVVKRIGLWSFPIKPLQGRRSNFTLLNLSRLLFNPPNTLSCQCRRPRLNPWVGKIPWKRKWQPTPVFLPGEFHGRRSLSGHNPWGHRVGHVLVTEHSTHIPFRNGASENLL